MLKVFNYISGNLDKVSVGDLQMVEDEANRRIREAEAKINKLEEEYRKLKSEREDMIAKDYVKFRLIGRYDYIVVNKNTPEVINKIEEIQTKYNESIENHKIQYAEKLQEAYESILDKLKFVNKYAWYIPVRDLDFNKLKLELRQLLTYYKRQC